MEINLVSAYRYFGSTQEIPSEETTQHPGKISGLANESKDVGDLSGKLKSYY